jgi:hypothetical protein
MSHLSWQIGLLILFAIPISVAFVGIIVDAMLYQKRKNRIARLRGHNPYSVGRDAHRDVRGIHR